jgi:hypothetical protein
VPGIQVTVSTRSVHGSLTGEEFKKVPKALMKGVPYDQCYEKTQ